MKRLCFIAIMGLFASAGFTQNLQLENFELKTDTQTATFFIGQGWVGVSASMPILNEIYRPKMLNGKNIYFDESYRKQVADKLPDCFIGRPEIKVVAKIYLKEKTVSISTVPVQSRTIYEAIVIELIDMQVTVTPCD